MKEDDNTIDVVRIQKNAQKELSNKRNRILIYSVLVAIVVLICYLLYKPDLLKVFNKNLDKGIDKNEQIISNLKKKADSSEQENKLLVKKKVYLDSLIISIKNENKKLEKQNKLNVAKISKFTHNEALNSMVNRYGTDVKEIDTNKISVTTYVTKKIITDYTERDNFYEENKILVKQAETQEKMKMVLDSIIYNNKTVIEDYKNINNQQIDIKEKQNIKIDGLEVQNSNLKKGNFFLKYVIVPASFIAGFLIAN